MGEQRQVHLGQRGPHDAALGRLAAHPADAGAGHLHVEDRVLDRLLAHRGQVEGGGLVERAHRG